VGTVVTREELECTVGNKVKINVTSAPEKLLGRGWKRAPSTAVERKG